MIVTQFNECACPMPNATFGSVDSVKTLQQTLRSRGKPVLVTGKVDGPTTAAIFEIVRDNFVKLKAIPKIPPEIFTTFEKLKAFDAKVKQLTLNAFSSTDLFRSVDSVISAIRRISGTAADAVQKGAQEVFDNIDKAASVLNIAVLILAAPPGTTPAQIQASLATTDKPFFKKPLFWAAVGGGALGLAGIGYLLFGGSKAVVVAAPAVALGRRRFYRRDLY